MMDQRMDGRTDGRTNKAGCRVAWHATKKTSSVTVIAHNVTSMAKADFSLTLTLLLLYCNSSIRPTIYLLTFSNLLSYSLTLLLFYFLTLLLSYFLPPP